MAEGIVYQNKDVEFKIPSESYKEKSFEAYGLKLPIIRMIVVYTGDVQKAKRVFCMGCMTLVIEPVFVASLPVKRIYKTVKRKLEQGKALTDQELMQLIILLISKENSEAIRREIHMTKVGRLLIEEGIEQGIEQGIEAFILDNLEEQITEERILEKLQRRFRLKEEEARAYFEKYALVVQCQTV